MNDVRLLLEIRAWLQGEEIALPDPVAATQEIEGLLPRTRQKRRRRQLLPVIHRRNESLTVADTIEPSSSTAPSPWIV